MTLNHGSKTRFDSFRLPEDMAALSGASNGFLGTWFVRDSHRFVAEGYAGSDGFIAMVEEPDPAAVHRMALGKLVALHGEADDAPDPHAFYAEVRGSILAAGKDWIEIVEKDGTAPMVVSLRPEMITEIRWEARSPEPEMSSEP